jgi:hypothetical protein
MADPAHPGPVAASQTEGAQATAALRRMLAKLRTPAKAASARARPLEGQPPLGLVSAIIEEIDETVMARTLVLRNAEGQQMRLGVCNRRLLHADAPDGGATRNLTYAGGGDLASLRAVLERFGAPGGVTVEAAPASGAATLEQTGVAVATLRDAWESAAAPPSPAAAEANVAEVPASGGAANAGPGGTCAPEVRDAATWDRLVAFLAECEADAEAICAVSSSGAGFRRGDTDTLASALDEVGADLLMDLDGALLLEAAPGASTLLLAAPGAERALLRLRPGSGANVLAGWSRHFGMG